MSEPTGIRDPDFTTIGDVASIRTHHCASTVGSPKSTDKPR